MEPDMPSETGKEFRISRGRFLAAGGLAAVAVMFAGPMRGAELTAAEKNNLDVVTRFCASFQGRDISAIASFLSDGCIYRMNEAAWAIKGTAAITTKLKLKIERAESVEFKVLDSWARGDIVVNERMDSILSPPRAETLHVTGVFFLRDGKIAEWTDYLIR